MHSDHVVVGPGTSTSINLSRAIRFQTMFRVTCPKDAKSQRFEAFLWSLLVVGSPILVLRCEAKPKPLLSAQTSPGNLS